MDIDSGASQPYVGLGVSNYHMGDKAKAKENIEKAITMDDLAWPEYVHIAKYYHAIGDDEKALEYVDKAIAINPNFGPSIELKKELSS